MYEELAVLKEVAGKLDKAGVPYMVSGSVAMNFYAQPRMAKDIDHSYIDNWVKKLGFEEIYKKAV